MTIIETPLINRDPEIMSGMAVFMGTRVPIDIFFDWLEDDCSIEEYVDSFPSVATDQATEFLQTFRDELLETTR